ncbi:MAG: rhodanese-like domain-containing protein [Rubinisphaera brasiliensis]|uniref:rhodanese-like domain-containing protein n=1 Tax=Rubinisphaera brasiliensis TaxID=119 RepID=UPI003919F05F|nr:rhodanese-like domain-containing protein [bacterium]
MQTINRQQARELIDNEPDLAVVEVLNQEEYADFHLPRAEHVPYGDQFDQQIEQKFSDKTRPMLVYCKNTECPASEKAASRLDELGYRSVFDYEAGKVDWKEAGLPVER